MYVSGVSIHPSAYQISVYRLVFCCIGIGVIIDDIKSTLILTSDFYRILDLKYTNTRLQDPNCNSTITCILSLLALLNNH